MIKGVGRPYQKVYSIDYIPKLEDTMKAFRATGTFKTGKFSSQKFTIEIASENEASATEQVLSNLGSRHKLNRKQIMISEIKLIQGEEITNTVVMHLTGGAQ
jgi:large subunit ribosomal protein LX